MICKIYCYEGHNICDLVFRIKDFGVVSIEHYPVDEDWNKMNWDDLKEYESTLKFKYVKTIIGTV